MGTLPVLLLLLATGLTAAEIPLGPREVVVLYGDSITEQHRHAAFIEAWCLTRYPDRDLTVWNLGWSGDTAQGGVARYRRDVGPRQPTLVVVNYGMNDGGYRAPDAAVQAAHLAQQEALAELIAASGARQVLLTTSPVDPDRRPDLPAYNRTLAGFAEGLAALAARRGLVLVDQLTPLLTLQTAAKVARPGFTLCRDGVHPELAGSLAMAYHLLRRLPEARPLGTIILGDGEVRANGGIQAEFRPGEGRQAEVLLPFLPLPVPAAARPILPLVPIQKDLNALILQAPGLAPGSWELRIDGQACGAFTAGDLDRGVDIALLDRAPWARAGQRLLDLGRIRQRVHLARWREGDLLPEGAVAADLPGWAALAGAQARVMDEAWAAMRALARPAPARLALVPTAALALGPVQVSSALPFPGPFAMAVPPEGGTGVTWTTARPGPDGDLDLEALLGGGPDRVATVRLRLVAASAATLRLELGSDDGLVVLLDGKRRLERDVARGCVLGDDRLDLELTPGPHELLLRVNQRGGGWALAVAGRTLAGGPVWTEPPAEGALTD